MPAGLYELGKAFAGRKLADLDDLTTTRNFVSSLIKHHLSPQPHHAPLPLPEVHDWCRHILTGGVPVLQFTAYLTTVYGAPRRCSNAWSRAHMAYRCRDCGTSPSSCICVQCFNSSDHTGHAVSLYQSAAGGCCDCGDPDAWAPTGCCPEHTTSEPDNAVDENNDIMPGSRSTTTNGHHQKPLKHMPRDGFEDDGSVNLPSILDADDDKTATADRGSNSTIIAATITAARKESSKFSRRATIVFDALMRLVPENTETMMFLIEVCRWNDRVRELLCECFISDRFFTGDVPVAKYADFVVELCFDGAFKRRFAVEFIPHYFAAVSAFRCIDDVDALEKVSVQLFTVPEIVRTLCREHDFANQLAKGIVALLDSVDINGTTLVNATAFYRPVLDDLQFVVSNLPSTEWNLSLTAMDPLLTILLKLIRMRSTFHTRIPASQDHVPMEREDWDIHCALENEILELFVKISAARPSTLLDSLSTMCILVHDSETSATTGPVSTSPTSLHVPVHRAIALCLGHLGDQSARTILSPIYSSRTYLIEPPLRALVMHAQSVAGLWTRNGMAVAGPCSLYMSPYWSSLSHHLDVSFVQSLTLNCPNREDMDTFVQAIISRFELETFVSEPPVFFVLAEHALRLFIWFVSDRSNKDTAEEGEKEKDQIRHYLCVQEHICFSELHRMVSKRISAVQLSEILDEIAEFEPPLVHRSGRYRLKQTEWKHFDRHHMSYTRQQRSQAIDRFEAAADAIATTAEFVAQKRAASVKGARVLQCPILLQTCLDVVSKAARTPANVASSVDAAVQCALDLLHLMIDVDIDIVINSNDDGDIIAHLLRLLPRQQKYCKTMLSRLASFRPSDSRLKAVTVFNGEAQSQQRRARAKKRQLEILSSFASKRRTFDGHHHDNASASGSVVASLEQTCCTMC